MSVFGVMRGLCLITRFLERLDLSLTKIPPPSDPYNRALIFTNFLRTFRKICENVIFTKLYQGLFEKYTKKLIYTKYNSRFCWIFRREPNVAPLRLKLKFVCVQNQKQKKLPG